MPGYNHYSHCTCGWCVGGGGGSGGNWHHHSGCTCPWCIGGGNARSSTFEFAPHWPRNEATARSYTNPNARCPVCGDPVFFYRSPHGGRVFFDQLGPPWPKHPCMDNPRLPVQRNTSVVPTPMPRWQNEGWEPVKVDGVERRGDWAWVKLKRFGGSGFITRATPWVEGLAAGCPAHMKPINELGVGRISLLVERAGEWVEVFDFLLHRSLSAASPTSFREAMEGNADAAFAVATSSYKSWAKRPVSGTSQPQRSPRLQKIVDSWNVKSFVDLSISKQWLKRAAILGSKLAVAALETEPEFRKSEAGRNVY